MSKLVICEKPSVAKSIASALGVTSRADGYFEGGGWLISWCIGHLVGLADAAAYDDRYKKWRYEDLPILPDPFRYVVSEEKAAQFHILRSLMERPDVTELVNACDAGREGELIFRLVYEAAGCSKPFSRLWISSMEDVAIREGFVDLRPGADYDPLYQSALCRQKADWLIGINASRLFSVLYHRTLNIGRVQTPTLAMLADRDSKIVLFRNHTLGLVHQIDYYTGVVFRGYVEGAGDAVLSGGRYDSLVGVFGREAQATGFAVDVDAMARTLPEAAPSALDTVVHYAPGYLAKALEAVDSRPAGTCELSPCRTLESSCSLAREKGAKTVLVFDVTGERVVKV